MVARDYTEWLGDLLPIQSENPAYDANKSYLSIECDRQIEGLALIGRISWRTLTDENNSWLKLNEVIDTDQEHYESNPFINAISDPRDIYIKYYNKPFFELTPKPICIIDQRIDNIDLRLKNDYLAHHKNCDYLLLLPEERLSKNKIIREVFEIINEINIKQKSIIIADIAVWEANIYQLALENAKYDKLTYSKIDKIVLITRRLSVCVLTKTNNTFKINQATTKEFFSSFNSNFTPDSSLRQFVELIRTHDSMIFWQHIKSVNKYGEYFLNKDIVWYQDKKDIGLKGYLNFAKTQTDSFCKKIYEFSLERTLCLSNQYGCKYKSIDVLTNKLAMQHNSLFYNKNNNYLQKILLGSVFVSGYSQRASEIGQESKSAKFKIHFFHNQGVKSNLALKDINQFLLWPLKGENWMKGNLEGTKENNVAHSYRRVGTSFVIAPFGWKYFPIPRYKLLDKRSNIYLDEYSIEQCNSNDYKFDSVYKCSPPETYSIWQGKRTQILSIGHVFYESNHDLFNIDFTYIVNESFMIGGMLAQFLTAEFLLALGCDESEIPKLGNDKLINGVKEYINREYPKYSTKLPRLFNSI